MTPVAGRTQIPSTARLSRERVLRAALDLADAEGLGALTMRRLAADLDVGVMSLYRYVETKQDLLDGIVHLAMKPLSGGEPQRGTWESQMPAAIRQLYAALRAHPGATQALAGGLIPGPALDPTRDALLGILLAAGFDRGQAVTYLHTMFTYAIGFAVVAGHNPVAAVPDADRIAAFGHLSGAAEEFAGRFSQESFDAGLDVIIAGMRAHLSR